MGAFTLPFAALPHALFASILTRSLGPANDRTRADTRRQPQRALDQPAPPFVVLALREHTIEHERHGNQPLHALRDALLSDLEAAGVILPECFEDRPLRLREGGDAVL